MISMKWYVRLLFCLILFVPGSKIRAQLGAASLTKPGMAFSVDNLGPSNYIQPEGKLKTRSTTAQKRYNFGAAFMLSNKVDTATHKVRTWSLAAMGSYVQLTNEGYNKNIFPKELLTTGLTLQHFRNLRNKWGLMAIVSVTLSYDLEAINGDDIFLNGGALFIKQKSPHFVYGFGAMLTNAFGTPMVLPGFMLKWQTENKFRIDINLPEKVAVSYDLDKSDELGLAFRMSGKVYNLQNQPESSRLMIYKEMSLGLENTLHLGKKVDFTLSGGSILYSGVEFRERALSDMFKTKPFHRLAANYFLSAGLRWNFQPRK